MQLQKLKYFGITLLDILLADVYKAANLEAPFIFLGTH